MMDLFIESSLGYIPPVKPEEIDKLDTESIDYLIHEVNILLNLFL